MHRPVDKVPLRLDSDTTGSSTRESTPPHREWVITPATWPLVSPVNHRRTSTPDIWISLWTETHLARGALATLCSVNVRQPVDHQYRFKDSIMTFTHLHQPSCLRETCVTLYCKQGSCDTISTRISKSLLLIHVTVLSSRDQQEYRITNILHHGCVVLL